MYSFVLRGLLYQISVSQSDKFLLTNHISANQTGRKRVLGDALKWSFVKESKESDIHKGKDHGDRSIFSLYKKNSPHSIPLSRDNSLSNSYSQINLEYIFLKVSCFIFLIVNFKLFLTVCVIFSSQAHERSGREK